MSILSNTVRSQYEPEDITLYDFFNPEYQKALRQAHALFAAEDDREYFSDELKQHINTLVNHGLQYLLEVEGVKFMRIGRFIDEYTDDLQRIPQSYYHLEAGQRAARIEMTECPAKCGYFVPADHHRCPSCGCPIEARALVNADWLAQVLVDERAMELKNDVTFVPSAPQGPDQSMELARQLSLVPSQIDQSLLILVGSEHSTARSLAATLARVGEKVGPIELRELDDYDFVAQLPLERDRIVLFIVSTWGEGEPPTNAVRFYHWISDPALPVDLLANLRYSLFALGNRMYEHYQACGRHIDQRLQALGVQPLVERHEGDDSGTLEDDFIAWQTVLWPRLTGQAINVDAYNAVEYTSSYRLQYHPRSDSNAMPAEVCTAVTVVGNRELLSTSDASTRYVRLRVPTGTGEQLLAYQPGDHVGVYPMNDPANVAFVGDRMGWDMNAVFTLVTTRPEKGNAGMSPGHFPFSKPMTVREALLRHVDLSGPLRKGTLWQFVRFVTDKSERAALEQRINEVNASHTLNLHQLVRDFPSLRIPLEHVLQWATPMSPRFYSIASCPSMATVDLVVSEVKAPLPSGELLDGLCSGYLRSLTEGARVPSVFIKRSTFKLPADHRVPLILVGASSGIAPLVSFVRHRRALNGEHGEGDSSYGRTLLVFGCRYPDDYAELKQELTTDLARINGKLVTTYSQVQEAQRWYVQHELMRLQEEVWHMLEDGAHIYVCGRTQLAREVKDTVSEIVRLCLTAQHGTTYNDVEQAERVRLVAESYCQHLWDSERYMEDVWA